ncbi:endonuclease domain-containing protein [Rhizobium sp. GCM10022189]|uniref:endonuclease domain-containing protein n=1 Tax=Rhizobium sp. GCM10022189 TaxID=3252654 RepID=UPI003620F0DF
MPHSNIRPQTRERARRPRRELTKAESAMWNMLRDLRPYGARFRRETPIGPYIADFAWLSSRLIVEVDGDSHETEGGRRHDLARDAFLKDQGFTVLRFDNAQLLDGPDHVFVEIQKHAAPHLKEPA